ncbi:phospholipase D-like domain-containing protein [Methanosarcina sp.]|uniref:phospholipase D-like domain-containing protein n=1 Tax=Methanosarcina sp. TaxID=2213 RepID=UPI002BE7CD59|nr:phospholipase D-like domain-containing protein [Methanosarcina sp.]HOW13305.1 phospholipase D-like domain-containing protein [Methanosarcina sp.]
MKNEHNTDNVEILVTGPIIMNGGIRGTETVIEELINEAKHEIHLVSYLFTSKALHILELIKEASERGVKVTIIVNDIESQEHKIVSELKAMSLSFPYVKVYDFKDPKNRPLHAKIIISDRNKAVVGSANFSWGGLYTNYEIGLLIKGPIVWELSEVVDNLTSYCVP